MYLLCLPRTASPGRLPPRPSIRRGAFTVLSNAHGFTSTSAIVCDSFCLPPRALLQPECGCVLSAGDLWTGAGSKQLQPAELAFTRVELGFAAFTADPAQAQPSISQT